MKIRPLIEYKMTENPIATLKLHKEAAFSIFFLLKYLKIGNNSKFVKDIEVLTPIVILILIKRDVYNDLDIVAKSFDMRWE